ncbi:hypothetical protein ACSBR2_033650 [Camellia fascicularis]
MTTAFTTSSLSPSKSSPLIASPPSLANAQYGDDRIVHYRTGNVGLQAQWLEAWWPSSDDEFAFVVEDDLELSPPYYKFLRGLVVNYYYNASNFNPSIYGASLQRPRFVPGKHGNKLQLDSGTRLFLYQLVGTWGQLLFPRPWKEFRLWYDTHKAKGIKPFLQGTVIQVLPDRVVRSFDELGSVLCSLQKLETIILMVILRAQLLFVTSHNIQRQVCRGSSMESERRQFQSGIAMRLELGILAQKRKITQRVL